MDEGLSGDLVWHKVLSSAVDLPEGRVVSAWAGHKGICVSHFEGKFAALTNKCPHQGGPLGEGSIEKGYLRCPWHGWDFHPLTGRSPEGFDDGLETFEIDVRDDGVYVGVPEEPPHETTVSDVVTETLINWGIDTVFGMVGHSNLGLADAFRRKEEKERLKFIGIRHEGAGAFAASAYGKLTGRPAACFAIAGPGSTNMFTGLWDAKVDRSPILALTGQVATQVVGTGNFQEVDLVRAFQTVADFNHRVQRDSNHAELASLAVKHAILNRDVSHLTFPDEIQKLPAKHASPQTPDNRITPLGIAPPEESLKAAAKKIRQSKRPVIIVGHGARFNMEPIVGLADSLNCPVMTTFKAKGQIADDHPLGCGVLGRSGTPVASWFMNEADLLIVFGASFSNHTGIAPKVPTIQVDFDPLALSKFHKIEVAVWGEIGVTVTKIRELVDGKTETIDQRNEIAERKSIWRTEKEKRMTDDFGQGISSISVFNALSDLAPDNAVICVDVGNNAYSLGRYFECRRQTFVMSGYLGSIGFALPAALGAWAAVKGDRPVIAVAGDGGLAQYLAELTTSVKYGMDIKVVLLNNSELGKISKEQRSDELDVWATRLHNPNFAEFATSCGALGIRVERRSDIAAAMDNAFSYEGTALIELMTDVNLI
ncbi:MAG: thiamine pyrophosphate-binding protein [Acidobacteria bacterium]|nr:MAG: thiamine pyrophosphate-binding protein [Acidobacteriota bacterium]REK03160.1 MAG: thiamine pyrophosphate-binding protein [Acidobacteriota bacterium]REK15386.1 MAG: thiamine pyrophosphate-binding protein [Acidobacteriota bacterium]REK42105.1 MAG: thiamine pyrophosphate-binding protein [Acidobacteriota bacterium]